MTPPTCEELFNEELGDAVQTKDDASWRHGYYRTEVYLRESDWTFWETSYQVSTNGETNGLREGDAAIVQVFPHEVTTTIYKVNP